MGEASGFIFQKASQSASQGSAKVRAVAVAEPAGDLESKAWLDVAQAVVMAVETIALGNQVHQQVNSGMAKPDFRAIQSDSRTGDTGV